MQSLVLTALLAIIIIYHYAIIGHLRFPKDFVVDVDGDEENAG